MESPEENKEGRNEGAAGRGETWRNTIHKR
jgi:hypothetical protein